MQSWRDGLVGNNEEDFSENNVKDTEDHARGKTNGIGNVKQAWADKRVMPVTDKDGRTMPRRKPKLRKLWLSSLMSFANEASVVGLRYVANPSASVIRRCIWVLLILVGAAFTTYQIQDRIRRYARYPVNINIRVKHMEEMRFPTVTICNENRASLARVRALGKSHLKLLLF